jgi:hypothetical protein
MPQYLLDRKLGGPQNRSGWRGEEFLTLPWLELRPLGRPARSQLLYGLRYPCVAMDKGKTKFNSSDKSQCWSLMSNFMQRSQVVLKTKMSNGCDLFVMCSYFPLVRKTRRVFSRHLLQTRVQKVHISGSISLSANKRCSRWKSEPGDEGGRAWVRSIWTCRADFWGGHEVGDSSHKCLITLSRTAYACEVSHVSDYEDYCLLGCDSNLVCLMFTDVSKVLSLFNCRRVPWRKREHGVVSSADVYVREVAEADVRQRPVSWSSHLFECRNERFIVIFVSSF